MRRPVLAFALLLPVLAFAADINVARREVGNLVLEDIPEIPKRIVERTNQYHNTRSASFLDFDPRSGGMLVVTRFADTAQLHLVASPGSYRQQLTFFPDAVTEGHFDPKRPGQGFIFRMDVGGNEFYQYFWYDSKTGKHTLITDGKSRNTSLVPANAGGRWAYASTRRNGTDFDIYLQDSNDPGSAKLVKEVKGSWHPSDWSSDDKRLLLVNNISINEVYLHVLDLGTGESKEINPRTPGTKVAYGAAVFARHEDNVYYSSDEGAEFLQLVKYELGTGKKTVLTPNLKWDVDDIAVSADGKWLAYTTNEGGTSALYLAQTSNPTKADKVTLPAGVIYGLRFDETAPRVGFTMSGARTGQDAYTVEVATRAVTRWTFSELGGLDPESFVEPELIEFVSFDRRKIPAWLYKPRGKPQRPLPVIINIHGGPEAQTMASFNPVVQYWVNELGAAVLLPNVRGSSGYGKSYLQLDNAEKREDSVKDIGKLLDWIATRPELDKTRVGVIGGSYGGYMVLASMAHFNDRLRCGVDVVGISNFVTFLERTESYRRDLRRVEYGDERDAKMRAFLQSISPTNLVQKISKPMFVAQGANDPRVPASEAEQMVTALRTRKTPVWYLLAKDEGHGFQKKVNRDHYLNAASLFFETYLLQ
ncbi:MAG: alpha/beta fold hydrolase [Myxococcota bacterium]